MGRLSTTECTYPTYPTSASHRRGAQRQVSPRKHKANWKPKDARQRALLKRLGGGQPPSLPWHAQPQTHEIQDANSNLGISKVFWNPCLGHDTIWRPGQEMKVYVDNRNM